jgi:flagellar P-ring protein precursor FlgI
MKHINKYRTMILIAAAALMIHSAFAERIKDITTIKGIRGNPLSGVGLVTGLSGSGDKSQMSLQMVTSILRRLGLVFNPTDLSAGSVAVVMVSAELGPFDTLGSRIDVSISTLQDASSLQGGTLHMTELQGGDGQVYAVASGPIFLGGFAASGNAASAKKNHPTVGRIPDGAHVEKEELSTYIQNIAGENYIILNLRNKDFSTAVNIQKSINEKYSGIAVAKNAGSVQVKIPAEIAEIDVSIFIDNVGLLLTEVDMPAMVVINEKTGTIVVGDKVGISACAISQGGLVVKIKESAFVSQPQAQFSNTGSTEVIPDTSLEIMEDEGYLIPIEKVMTVSELAKALNSIGATPRDLIAIFTALKVTGALQAELKMM